MSELIVDGKATSIDLSPFDPKRFRWLAPCTMGWQNGMRAKPQTVVQERNQALRKNCLEIMQWCCNSKRRPAKWPWMSCFSFPQLHGGVSEKCKDAIEAPVSWVSCCCSWLFFQCRFELPKLPLQHSPGSWHHRAWAIVLSIAGVHAAVFPLARLSRLKAWILHNYFCEHPHLYSLSSFFFIKKKSSGKLCRCRCTMMHLENFAWTLFRLSLCSANETLRSWKMCPVLPAAAALLVEERFVFKICFLARLRIHVWFRHRCPCHRIPALAVWQTCHEIEPPLQLQRIHAKF